MFTFNDGQVHDSVEVFGDLTHWEALELVQVGATTQYVCAASSIIALEQAANGPAQYKFRVDGQWVLVPGLPTAVDTDGNRNQVYDSDAMIVSKHLWEAADTNYLWHTPAVPSGLLIFIVPGNPGLCEYYEETMAGLARLLPGAEIVAVSHRGFRPEARGTPPLVGLDAQIDEKVEFLRWFRAAQVPHVSKVAVLGHSVGAWIAQRVAVRAPDIVFAGLLTPTLRNIAHSERGKQFIQLTRFLGAETASWSVWCAGFVPFASTLLMRLIKRLMPEDSVPASARWASLGMVQNPGVVKQIVSLAIEEMQRIGPDEEPADIRGFWDAVPRVWALFAAHDHWVSAATREELIELAASKPNVATITVDGLRHAFCIRESHQVAGLIAHALQGVA